jgi:hypothetical protein
MSYKNVNDSTDMNHIFMAVNWGLNPDAGVLIFITIKFYVCLMRMRIIEKTLSSNVLI